MLFTLHILHTPRVAGRAERDSGSTPARTLISPL